MVVRPEIRVLVVKEVDDRARLPQLVHEPAITQLVVRRDELSYAPFFLRFQELPGQHPGNQAVKTWIMEVERCVFHLEGLDLAMLICSCYLRILR